MRDSPAAILAAAANRVRDLAAAAVPAPWESALAEVDHAGRYEREMVADCGDSRTADWIALVSPAVAPALEQTLRDAAKSFAVESKIWKPEVIVKKLAERRYAGPMALARSILGEEVAEGDR